ncbi:response regulator [Spirosoma linguale]|uniref:Response regulator receiver protein n=1 Tax=Spirosoma linguale (strain ATCC 33905 / DSM 74 / LMG 10896 / Claus 1) TaxID=504472 RepID=D2QM98_SPILD|nr:response regulator receiver protein [Spirosoma linguale DSM 74]
METTRSLSIFILDDNPFCGTITEQHIRNLDYTDVDLFTDEETCLNQLGRRPDIIFLDYPSKSPDGLDIIRKIGRINPDIYIVVFTDQENREATVHSRKYGAFDYVVRGHDDLNKIHTVLKKIEEVMTLLELRPPGSTTLHRS